MTLSHLGGLCALLLLPFHAQAQTDPSADIPADPTAACIAHVEGVELVLNAADPGDAADPALAATTNQPACDPATVLRHFTPDLPDGTRAAFCLVRDEMADGTPTFAGFSEGARDESLVCTTGTSRFCERVNASRDAALEIAGLGDDPSAVDTAGAAVDGIRGLRERAGATILTGTGGAVASTLGNIGASALAAVTAPVAVAAGVVSVVAVGGAVYVCQ